MKSRAERLHEVARPMRHGRKDKHLRVIRYLHASGYSRSGDSYSHRCGDPQKVIHLGDLFLAWHLPVEEIEAVIDAVLSDVPAELRQPQADPELEEVVDPMARARLQIMAAAAKVERLFPQVERAARAELLAGRRLTT